MDVRRALTMSLLSVVVGLTACGSVAPDTIALADAEETSIEPLVQPESELGSEPAELAVATTTTTTSTTTNSTTTPSTSTTTTPAAEVVPESSTSSTTTTTTSIASELACQAGDDFPEFEGAVAAVDVDMDADGELDQVFLLADSDGLAYDAWVAVTFARGGIATGKFDGFFEPSPVHGLQVADLTNGLGTAPEIIFTATSGPAISQVAVMTLVDCAVVTTTLFGEPFSFDTGATSNYTSVFTLEGSVWTRLERHSSADFPDLDSPTRLSLQDCTGLTINE